MANLEADGLNATGGELRLGGVEAAAVGSHHLHHHPINAALRHLPPHTLVLPPPPRRLPLWKRDLGSELSGGKDWSGAVTPHAPCGLRRGEIDRAESPKLRGEKYTDIKLGCPIYSHAKFCKIILGNVYVVKKI